MRGRPDCPAHSGQACPAPKRSISLQAGMWYARSLPHNGCGEVLPPVGLHGMYVCLYTCRDSSCWSSLSILFKLSINKLMAIIRQIIAVKIWNGSAPTHYVCGEVPSLGRFFFDFSIIYNFKAVDRVCMLHVTHTMMYLCM